MKISEVNDYINIHMDTGVGQLDEWNIYLRIYDTCAKIYIGSRYSFDSNSYGYLTIYYTKTK